MKKTKKLIEMIKVEGFINMEHAPSDLDDFLKDFNGWLGDSKWNFEGKLLVPQYMSVEEFKKKVFFKSLKDKFFSVALMVSGAYAMVLFGAGDSRLVGITAIITMWYAGVLFEKGFNK